MNESDILWGILAATLIVLAVLYGVGIARLRSKLAYVNQILFIMMVFYVLESYQTNTLVSRSGELLRMLAYMCCAGVLTFNLCHVWHAAWNVRSGTRLMGYATCTTGTFLLLLLSLLTFTFAA